MRVIALYLVGLGARQGSLPAAEGRSVPWGELTPTQPAPICSSHRQRTLSPSASLSVAFVLNWVAPVPTRVASPPTEVSRDILT